MRLTKEDGQILLGAIQVELESQRWRQKRRSEYGSPLPYDIEQGIQQQDQERAETLRSIRDKIKSQIA